ncbi:MAG: hypothetical protein ACRDG3_08640 [Tepidiformaceae bacterium]
MDVQLPNHVVIQRRDGRREILLHRSMALISENKVEIKSARSMVIIPALGLLIAGCAVAWLAVKGFDLPLWLLIVILLTCLILVPFSVMGLISAIVGADVIVDKEKNSATWQQGYLGMGIGTKELVPFEKIAYLEVTIEGDQPDRWRDQTDALRQFALTLVKRSGKRLTLAQVPVPAYGQADGMDRTLAVGNAIAALTGTTVRLPEGWELVQIDTSTGDILPEPKADSPSKASSHTKGRQKSRLRR